jgi:hypothetical protein
MKKDDLTQVKNIGSARMKLLNSRGITTIQQLYEIPLEKLEQIKGLGKHYAKLIKDAVNDIYAEKEETPERQATEVSLGNERQTDRIDKILNRELANITKYLNTAKEKLKPIQKKKHAKLFVDFKKRSNRLKTHIRGLRQIQANLAKKQKKKITNKANTLNVKLKNVDKSKKSKTMRRLSREIQSFSKLIK